MWLLVAGMAPGSVSLWELWLILESAAPEGVPTLLKHCGLYGRICHRNDCVDGAPRGRWLEECKNCIFLRFRVVCSTTGTVSQAVAISRSLSLCFALVSRILSRTPKHIWVVEESISLDSMDTFGKLHISAKV